MAAVEANECVAVLRGLRMPWSAALSLDPYLSITYMPATTKHCSRCNTTKQLEEFGVNKNGILAQCLACAAYNASRKAVEREEAVLATVSDLPFLRDFERELRTAKCSEGLSRKLLVAAKDGMTVKLDTSMLDASSIAMEDVSKKIGDEIALRVWMMTGYRWIYKDCKRGLRGFPGPKRAVQYRYRCSQDRGAQRAPKKVADASKQRARKSKPCFDCKGRLKITIQVVHETWTAKISLEHHISHAPYEFKSSTGSTSPSGDDSSEQDDSMQFHIPSL